MTDAEQETLILALEKATIAFFEKRAKKTGADPRIDAVAVVHLLAEWAGEFIGGAPDHMREDLFQSFVGMTAEVAGLEDCDCDACASEQAFERGTLQ